MGDKLRSLLKQPLVRVLLLIAVLSVVGGVGWGVYLTQAPPPQPIEFRHDLHTGLGIQCLFCHPGAWTGPSPGLPTQSKCWGCHQQVEKVTPDLEKLANYVSNDEPIPWVPVAIMPDFVNFNHRPHIAAGLNCEACHGNISAMTVAEPQRVMAMGWCLDCHRGRAVDDHELLVKLTDCVTCHK
jgi:hypothetical protein